MFLRHRVVMTILAAAPMNEMITATIARTAFGHFHAQAVSVDRPMPLAALRTGRLPDVIFRALAQ
jgi:hypothetical protein